MWEVAGDEGVAHELAGGGNGDEEFEAIGETCGDLSNICDEDVAIDDCKSISLGSLPKSISGKITVRKVGVILVVVFPDEIETLRKSIA